MKIYFVGTEKCLTMIFCFFFLEKICCGYSLEALLRDASSEYPQHYVFMEKSEKYQGPVVQSVVSLTSR